ncbi:DotA/TraY family protein [Candidatus Methylospira mobilis]|uniref:DotA/TraY family protein n=1 Tax=Candidatus Methylospira mobilis TaxID=1808979 RepID=A0A5Q0BJI7_9GAMM|nr:DotA/TraY family protein [Candidatus Methylospira mobilis]QFY42327.1 DotA/TraY family protein [Candidatus Methylospira mobilis]
MNPDLSFVPAADVSVNAINSVIGAGWDGILTGSNPTGAGGVLLTIMFAFNGVGLAVAGIMVFYTAVAGTIDTAHQGEALGKRSTLWSPLRLVGGVALLMPLPWCQASLLQAIILKCVFLSIGFADFVNIQVTNQITANGGQISSPALPDNVNDVAGNLLEQLTIQTYFNVMQDMPSVKGLNAVATPNGQSFLLSLNSPDPSIPSPSMGYFEVPCSLGKDDPVCQARVKAIKDMLPNLQTAADAITSHWKYGANQDPDTNSMISAMNSYRNTVQSALVSWVQAQQPDENSAITQFAKVAQDQGWASLGSWYWTFAYFNAAVSKVATAQPRVGAKPDYEIIGSHAGDDLEVPMRQLKKYLATVSNVTTTSGSVGIASANEKFSTGWLAQLFPAAIAANAGANIVADLSEGDPIQNLQTRGQQLMTGAELAGLSGAALYGSIRAASGAADGASKSLWGLLGFGVLAKAPAEFAVGAADFVKDTAQDLISAAFFIGLVLTVYLPAVPFIIWSMAFIGWLLLIMEAVFAAPVWAIAHTLPEGDGFVGQSARRGYMLLMNILLRPALMTTGFFISFLLIQPVGKFIGTGFQVFTSGVTSNANLGAIAAPAVAGLLGLGVSALVQGLATILLGGVLLAMAEHSVFSIITALPENVMRWVEGQMGGLGENEKENKIQGLVMAKFGRMESAMKKQGGSGRLGRIGGKFSGSKKD